MSLRRSGERNAKKKKKKMMMMMMSVCVIGVCVWMMKRREMCPWLQAEVNNSHRISVLQREKRKEVGLRGKTGHRAERGRHQMWVKRERSRGHIEMERKCS